MWHIQALETKWRKSHVESNFKAKLQEVACVPMMTPFFVLFFFFADVCWIYDVH